MADLWLGFALLIVWMLPGMLVILYPRRCGLEQVGWILAGFSLSYPAVLLYRLRHRCICLQVSV
ncbi:hypothetical protein [Ferrimonas pelagia]|uniref:Uncharacterized protein n=1 Tax=Ferrimonas pelagia TaxID=1177826 RepID=A0ABP9EGY7_9GAMM